MKNEILYSLESYFKKANNAADEKEKQSLTFGYMVELDRTEQRIASYMKRNKLTNDDFEFLKVSIQIMNDNLGLITHKLPANYFS
jgi:hypothetical protein